MNRIKNICCIFIPCILAVLLLVIDINYTCPFKKITHIPCPGCGMTRSFHLLLKGDWYSALQYNILSIPLFIFIIISIVYLTFDIIKNQINYLSFLDKTSRKYGMVILLGILLWWIYNIVVNRERL